MAVRETAKPIALKSNRAIEAGWETARRWIVEGENAPWSVCLVTANADTLSVARLLAKRPDCLAAGVLSGDYVEQQNKVSVGTLSDVKGLEFSLIILVGCSSDIVPSPHIPVGEQWRDAMRFYVAMTRGRDQVVMTYEDKPSQFLEVMAEHLLWEETDCEENVERYAASIEKKVKLIRTPTKLASAAAYSKQQLSLSASSDLLLRKYFERYVRGKKASHSPQHFTDKFEQWRTPKNLNGLSASKLLSDGDDRKDLIREIDAFLRTFGHRLQRDC